MHCASWIAYARWVNFEYEFEQKRRALLDRIVWNCIASILKSIMRNWLPSARMCQQLNPQFLAIWTRLYNDLLPTTIHWRNCSSGRGIQIDVNQASRWLRLPGTVNSPSTSTGWTLPVWSSVLLPGGHRCSFEYATAATKAGAGAQILLLRREPYQSADQP